MKLEQFAKLRVDDKVRNGLTDSIGTVTETRPDGVKLRWGDGVPGQTVEFFFSVNSTAWFHWEQVEHDANPSE